MITGHSLPMKENLWQNNSNLATILGRAGATTVSFTPETLGSVTTTRQLRTWRSRLIIVIKWVYRLLFIVHSRKSATSASSAVFHDYGERYISRRRYASVRPCRSKHDVVGRIRIRKAQRPG